jgi:hypothetical protein
LVEPLQDLNPESRVQVSIPLGTELTLGEAGVEPNIVDRGGADRG